MGDGELDRLYHALTDHRPGGYEDEEAIWAAGVAEVLALLEPVLVEWSMTKTATLYRLRTPKETRES